jgi:anti-sigma factor RsiW
MDCGKAQALLAERVRGDLDAATAAEIDRHLAACQECASERALVDWLRVNAAVPPAGLADRVRSALQDPALAAGRRSRLGARVLTRRRTWALAAAAVAGLALGTSTLLDRDARPSDEEVWTAFFDGVRSVWVAGDGVVADAPVLSELSDDDLAALLEELEG